MRAQIWKQLKCPSTDEWMSKMWPSHTMEYFSTFKTKEILSHAITRMNLENILLSERIQSQKDVGFHFYETSRLSKSTQTEHIFIVIRGWVEGERSVSANSY